MASYNGERCIRLWELPSFEARGTLGDVNNARAMAGSAAAQLVFSGDEHGRVKVRPSPLAAPRCACAAPAALWHAVPAERHQLSSTCCAGQARMLRRPHPAACSPALLSAAPPRQVWKWKAVGAGGFPIAA